MALEDRLVSGGDDRIGELGREEAPEPTEPPELRNLRLDPLLEGAVQLCELLGLRLDRVVVALDPKQ